MPQKHFSVGSLFAGIFLGSIFTIVIATFVVWHFIVQAFGGPGSASNSEIFAQLKTGIGMVSENISTMQEEQGTATTITGDVMNINDESIQIRARFGPILRALTFKIDDDTQMLYLKEDGVTEATLPTGDVMVGNRVSIFTDEPIGSVENQVVVKVIKNTEI